MIQELRSRRVEQTFHESGRSRRADHRGTFQTRSLTNTHMLKPVDTDLCVYIYTHAHWLILGCQWAYIQQTAKLNFWGKNRSFRTNETHRFVVVLMIRLMVQKSGSLSHCKNRSLRWCRISSIHSISFFLNIDFPFNHRSMRYYVFMFSECWTKQ